MQPIDILHNILPYGLQGTLVLNNPSVSTNIHFRIKKDGATTLSIDKGILTTAQNSISIQYTVPSKGSTVEISFIASNQETQLTANQWQNQKEKQTIRKKKIKLFILQQNKQRKDVIDNIKINQQQQTIQQQSLYSQKMLLSREKNKLKKQQQLEVSRTLSSQRILALCCIVFIISFCITKGVRMLS